MPRIAKVDYVGLIYTILQEKGSMHYQAILREFIARGYKDISIGSIYYHINKHSDRFIIAPIPNTVIKIVSLRD